MKALTGTDRSFPGNRTEGEWYQNLPEPKGGISLAEVRKNVQFVTRAALMDDALTSRPENTAIHNVHGRIPEIPQIITDTCNVVLRNTMLWTRGELKPEHALESYKLDHARWPQHLRELMPWAEVERRLLQTLANGHTTQLELATGLDRGGILAGVTMYGLPFVADRGMVGIGLTHDEIKKRNDDYGYYFLSRGSKSRPGSDGKKCYEQRWIENATGDEFLPTEAGALALPEGANYIGCYLKAGEASTSRKREGATAATRVPYLSSPDFIEMTDPDTVPSKQRVGVVRFYAVHDFDRRYPNAA